jgi:CRISPR-associated protein Cas6
MDGCLAPESYLRLKFPFSGQLEIPIDVQSAHEMLYAGLSRICPLIHENDCNIRISPIRGLLFQNERKLYLSPRSHFFIQLPMHQLPQVLQIAGKFFRLGANRYRLGIPQIFALQPSCSLAARFVTARGKLETEEMFQHIKSVFQESLKAQEGKDYILHIRRRRVIRIKGKNVVGFGVLLTDIRSEQLSLQIQAAPPLGRGKYGAAFFELANESLEPVSKGDQ